MASAKELQQKANMAVAKGDMVGAVRFLTEAIGIDSSMDSLYSNRAYAYAGLGRHEDALKDAHTCIDLNPASSKGYLRAGRALAALGRAKEASVMLDEALEAHPQVAQLLIQCSPPDLSVALSAPGRHTLTSTGLWPTRGSAGGDGQTSERRRRERRLRIGGVGGGECCNTSAAVCQARPTGWTRLVVLLCGGASIGAQVTSSGGQTHFPTHTQRTLLC